LELISQYVTGLFFKASTMIRPHELFAAIYHSFPRVWKEWVYVSEDRCKKFWQSVRGGKHYQSHDVRLA
jgi:hypothetical protein